MSQLSPILEAVDNPVVFEYSDVVRDYECDMQGIVNNAVYANYLEHARHMFLRAKGYEFSDLVARGLHLVLCSIELHYMRPLAGGQPFTVRLTTERQGPKLLFRGDILRAADRTVCVRSVAKCVAVKDGQLTKGDFFDEVLAV